jgi:hypothetical protein
VKLPVSLLRRTPSGSISPHNASEGTPRVREVAQRFSLQRGELSEFVGANLAILGNTVEEERERDAEHEADQQAKCSLTGVRRGSG